MKLEAPRFWEVDSARGIAVIMMIVYHIFFDINFLQVVSIPLTSLAFQLFLYPIGSLFLLIVGISLVLSFQIYEKKHQRMPPFSKYFWRGVFLFLLALMITFITWIYPHKGYIVFGVIHCISISVILSYWFISRPTLSLFVGGLIIVLGVLFTQVTVESPVFFWLGLRSAGFYSLDYFPLCPWFGVVLIGLFAGTRLYPNLQKKYQRSQIIPTLAYPFVFLGKHALLIYIIHQPVIYGVLYLLFQ